MGTSSEKLLIGAHTSAAGGVFNALKDGVEIGATTIQLFTSNQKQWRGKSPTDEVFATWEQTLEETKLKAIMSHDSYLINLGSPNEEVLEKSIIAFQEEIQRCLSLGITYLNFHPGAALKSDRKECLDLIVHNLNETLPLLEGSSLTLLLETTAGQGSTIGWQFEELGYMIKHVHPKLPIGVCIDTCHIFAAGYDIRDANGWDATLKAFDEAVGLNYLKAFHLNDSMKPLASKRDRHAPLGEGEIGIKCFEIMMQDPKMRELPKYLETPGGKPNWKQEIKQLRAFAK